MTRGMCRLCQQPVVRGQRAVYAIAAYEIDPGGKQVHKTRRDNWVCHVVCFDEEMLRRERRGEQLSIGGVA